MTWEAFSQKIQVHFCPTRQIRKVDREFLALEKDTMSIAKYNSVFSERLQFGKSYCATNAKQVEHYVEGLPLEYQSILRQRRSLAAVMDEAIRIEVDLTTLGRIVIKGGEKRKWEGLSESSRKKKRVTRERRLIGLIFA